MIGWAEFTHMCGQTGIGSHGVLTRLILQFEEIEEKRATEWCIAERVEWLT
jgi:hypothetical protein